MKKSFKYHGMPVLVEYTNTEGSGEVDISCVECGGVLLNQYFENQSLWDDLEEELESELSKGEENEETDSYYNHDAADWSISILD